MFVLGKTADAKQFSRQAMDLKRIIADFHPKEVVIDTNGLGVGLADEMIKEQVCADGTILPAYGFINDDNYKKIQPKGIPTILYGVKANATLNPQIHSNAFTRINQNRVRFLISEQAAKSYLLATKQGQKMEVRDRVKRLMPHELTSKLFDEMLNLRLKKTSSSMDIVLEQINPRFPKDKYSAFAYGLWRIKELEEENFKKIKRFSNGSSRKLVFFTGR